MGLSPELAEALQVFVGLVMVDLPRDARARIWAALRRLDGME